MKWYTRDWESDRDEAYGKHIAELRPSLPKGLAKLAEGGGSIPLHDGWFIDALKEWESPDTILFDIRCWDMPMGRLIGNVSVYPMLHVRIRYYEAELVSPELSEHFRQVLRVAHGRPSARFATSVLGSSEYDIEISQMYTRDLPAKSRYEWETP